MYIRLSSSVPYIHFKPSTSALQYEMLCRAYTYLYIIYIHVHVQLLVLVMVYHLSGSNGLLLNGVQVMLNNGTFKIVSQPAVAAAEMLSVWIPRNKAKLLEFEEALVNLLMICIQSNSKLKLFKSTREKMWTSYHAVQTSKKFRSLWELFLKLLCLKVSPIFCQCVGNQIFKALVKRNFPLIPAILRSDSPNHPNIWL